ncbi:unnamed protein product, partial [Didymodactylos carnosus]
SACEGYGDILLVGCYDNTVHLWNTEGEHLSTLPGHNGPVRCVRWISSDENNQHCFLSSSHDEAIIRWLYNQNTNTVEELKTYKGHNGSVETISVDPTKTKFVSGSWDKTIKLWGIESGSSSPDKSENLNDKSLDARITINAHTENVSCVKWLNTNEIVSGSWDHSIKLWNMDTLKEAQTFKSTKAVIHCDYSQLNHLIVAGFCDRFIRLYDPRVSEGFVVRSTFTSHTQWVPSLSWSKTNEYVFVSGSYDSFVKLWDIRCSKAPLYDLQGHDNRVLCVDWTIPSLIISGGADNSLKLPVFVVQPTNITQLNIRPTQLQQQQQQQQQYPQPVYQISTVRTQTLPQQPQQQLSQTPLIYQVQPRLISPPQVQQTRLIISPIVQQPRIITSPTVQFSTSLTSPRLTVSQNIQQQQQQQQQQHVTSPPLTTSITRIVTPPTTSIPTNVIPQINPTPPAPGTKEVPVKVQKSNGRYGIMEFASGLSIDLTEWKSAEMRREINSFNYRPPTDLDAPTTTPKFGAGSEYGKEQRERLKRKRYSTKGTNIEDLPWLLSEKNSQDKKVKQYRGLKKGGVATNSSYYVFIKGNEGFEAYPVEDWYSFTPTNVYKTLDFDQAEMEFENRHRNLSKWFLKHQSKKDEAKEAEEEEDGEGQKKSGKQNGKKNEFKLLNKEDYVDEEEDDDEDFGDEDEDNGDRQGKTKNKTAGNNKTTGGINLSDDDDNAMETNNAGKKKPKGRKKIKTEDDDNEAGEDSDDGDHEGDELDYTSDETSEEEDDIKDANTLKSTEKYEEKGIDEQIKVVTDIDKKLEKLENDEEIDLEDSDNEEEEEDDDPGANVIGKDLSEVGKEMRKLLEKDTLNKADESSTDDDDLDDSDDPDKELIVPEEISHKIGQPSALEKAKEIVQNRTTVQDDNKTNKKTTTTSSSTSNASASSTSAGVSTSSNSNDAVTEEKIR